MKIFDSIPTDEPISELLKNINSPKDLRQLNQSQIPQIADELRKKFPKIFKDYPINHIWAFKYDSRAKNEKSSLKGINVHADFAAINVNFWITHKEANLNPNSGGLIVYDVEAPHDWDFKLYNSSDDKTKIREELKKSKIN